ncbi:MAG: LysM domain-containing protein [Chloroflexi bacterium]|nr:LysM domain-containing protein [Chloroflexota bacterium]
MRLSLLFPLFLLACVLTAAQESACEDVVQRALAAVAEQCLGLERDSLCIVSPPVQTDAASLVRARRIATSGYDAVDQNWGAALIRLAANLPQTYAGPGVLALLGGDAQIINEVAADAVMPIGEPLSTAAIADAKLYRLPGIIPEPVGDLRQDDIVLVDAWDSDSGWLRVVSDGAVAWVEADKVQRLQAMDALPRITIGQPYPLRSFSLRTSSLLPECASAEPLVAVQTPDDVPVNLTVNGVDIHIDSMVSFQQKHRGALSLTVHRGAVTTIYGQRIPEGESAIGILSPAENGAASALAWSGSLPASEAEYARGQRAQAAFNLFSRAHGWSEERISRPTGDVYHVVERGESVYSIAREYKASVADIIAANPDIDPRLIFAGNELLIPNAGVGFSATSLDESS